jgi:hypothetical protein
MSRAERGDKIIDMMSRKAMLTEEGASWLKIALDPFHDLPVQHIAGWPDITSADSVVRCVKKTMTITKPASLPDANWGFSVVVDPDSVIASYGRYGRANNVLSVLTATTVAGGVRVYCSEAPYIFDFQVGMEYQTEPDNIYLKGLCRIIGMGFEITDDTAELYKQGHCFHARQSNDIGPPFTIQVGQKGSTSQLTTATAVPVRAMYRTVESMTLNPMCVSWPAKQGSYTVCAFNGVNPPRAAGYETPFMIRNNDPDTGDDNVGGILTTNTVDVFVHSPIGVDANNMSAMPPSKVIPIDCHQSIYTGLHSSATFTVTVKYYIESFPSIAEKDVLVLASPSAPYDPVALEMYNYALAHLPVAVPVGDNPDGEWWAEVVEAATGVLAPMAAAFGFPEVTPFIMGGGAALASRLRSSVSNSRPLPSQRNAANTRQIQNRPNNQQLKTAPARRPKRKKKKVQRKRPQRVPPARNGQ